jgi:hypothetical protein
VPLGTAAHYGFLRQMEHRAWTSQPWRSWTWRRRTGPRPSRRGRWTCSAASGRRCLGPRNTATS